MVRHPTGIVTVASLRARVFYTYMSILSQLQVRVNKTLLDSLFSGITQLQIQHEGSSLVKSGTTRRLLGKYAAFLYFCTLDTETFPTRLERERLALHPMTIQVATLLQQLQWLNQSQIALDHARISSSFLTADATQAEWLFSTLTCFALSTHIDDYGRDFVTLAHNVKNLIETWQDLSVSHREARELTKRLEVKTFDAVCNNMLHFNMHSRNFPALIMKMHNSLANSPLFSVCERQSVRLLS